MSKQWFFKFIQQTLTIQHDMGPFSHFLQHTSEKTAKMSTKRAKLVDGRFRCLVLKTTHHNQQKADVRHVRGHVGIHARNLANHSA
jgi:hypothetical protein